MGITIGIDASRNRSGGAKAHIIGILNECNPNKHEIKKVHLWSYNSLLSVLPDYPWLVKHSPSQLERSILRQLIWQYFSLPKEVKKNNCDILLNTDAGTICPYQPSVTMSRDMLSFEKREIARYGLNKDWLRLYILRFVQSRSLKKSTSAIFLTKYASNTIQRWTGKLTNFTIIPHGVGEVFKKTKLLSTWPTNNSESIKCLYISNVAMYKHQWNVAYAIQKLRKKGFNITILFAGGGNGPAQLLLENTLKKIDPNGTYTKQIEFVAHQKIPELLAQANLFVFASSCENMPNTLVEAMSFGLPIACSNYGPMPEVLNNGGVFFDPENPDSIANSIEEILTNIDTRNFISKRSKELSEQYSWKRCAEETLGHLNYLVNKLKKNEF
jgi:glycosyltransferase involved in cell wall biosynthesis